MVERRARARRSKKVSDEEWQDEVRRFYRDILAGMRRIADVLERMANLKSGITGSVDGRSQDSESEGPEKTESGMD